MSNRIKYFKVVALSIAIYHAILGIIGTFAPAELATRIIQTAYGVDLMVGEQTLYLIKFISAYMLAFAAAMYLLSQKPIEYRQFVWVAVVLFGFRIFDRIFFFDMLQSGFGLTIQRDLITVSVIAVLCGLLVYLRPRTETEYRPIQ